jgi:hypothetical protein
LVINVETLTCQLVGSQIELYQTLKLADFNWNLAYTKGGWSGQFHFCIGEIKVEICQPVSFDKNREMLTSQLIAPEIKVCQLS